MDSIEKLLSGNQRRNLKERLDRFFAEVEERKQRKIQKRVRFSKGKLKIARTGRKTAVEFSLLKIPIDEKPKIEELN